MREAGDHVPGSIGSYTGCFSPGWDRPETRAAFAQMSAWIERTERRELGGSRDRNVALPLRIGTGEVWLAVKVFARRSALKDAADRLRGTPARRSWRTARALGEAGVGTPEPVAWLERWEGRRLAESYFVTVFEEGLGDFARELGYLFREAPECARFMDLMQCVADGVRKLHDAGFVHGDLGNQNILLRRTGDGWSDVHFVDLNRVRRRTPMSLHDRARDVSRIYLPSDLLRVFKEMYFVDRPPPAEFQRWEQFHRRGYAFHTFTRRFRHPIRSVQRRRASRGRVPYPSEKEQWIWDERSAQAIATLRPKDRRRYYPLARNMHLVTATLRLLPAVRRRYANLVEGAYRRPVSMQGRVGVSVEPRPATWDRERARLATFGAIPTLVRFYHHKGPADWAFRAAAVRELTGAGHRVSIALVQDRASVAEPARWGAFARDVLGRVADVVEYVELAHAINRVKWGIWDFGEYRRMLETASDLGRRYPGLRLVGPAVIDFEYPYVAAALECLPAGMGLDALSHHLYVDRRGAPESRQGRFASLEKFALARAIAGVSSRCRDRLIVSEVNWPLMGTGVYSPVTSPYESPGPRFNDPSVSEDDYADYMLRYLLIALCSGLVERVYWWRLVARGFGLVDDTDGDGWRERPACAMLRLFVRRMDGAVFRRRHALQGGVEILEFDGGEGAFGVAYGAAGRVHGEWPVAFARAEDAFGRVMAGPLAIGGRPVYLMGLARRGAAAAGKAGGA